MPEPKYMTLHLAASHAATDNVHTCASALLADCRSRHLGPLARLHGLTWLVHPILARPGHYRRLVMLKDLPPPDVLDAIAHSDDPAEWKRLLGLAVPGE